ncbi:hypothetical protein D3C85_1811480 [compost metagenome]
MRAMCGAIRPTKLSGPMVMVATAVKQAASSNNPTRDGVSATPTARAVSPPNGRIVIQRRNSGVIASSNTIAIPE